MSRRKRRTNNNNADNKEEDKGSEFVIPQSELSILDSMINGCVVIGEDGYIQYVNPALSAMFGYSSAELIGMNVKLLMPSMYAAHHDKFVYFASIVIIIIIIGP